MADLQVDDRVLADSERRLSRLHGEFARLGGQRDSLHAELGAPAMAGAMDEFFDNWSHYRKKLLGSIESVGTLVSQTRSTFRRVDERLASGAKGDR
ncbi:hypothetical protein [Streptomyces sp. ICBB 8177]|uniref:hypothetical protein n=1 Tax=Streptomyces sp. ICBB 8177 TaxID=563922 RepID=UPI000D673A66|nr:hypothetical protein [Streptomyces sp. ICBB 8177]PWI45902.1 hypothetical protein CK485_01760 [Streptomyces sp. ICBB 8177]